MTTTFGTPQKKDGLDEADRTYFIEPRESNTTWEEIGFAEFPIVTTAKRKTPFSSLEFLEKVGRDSKTRQPIYRQWKMVGSKDYGLPLLQDLDLFIALLKLAERGDYKVNFIKTTAKELCTIAGVPCSGTAYKTLKAGLIRFKTTSYIADQVFKDPKTKQPILLEGWSIIDQARLLPHYTNTTIKDGLPPSYIKLGDKFLTLLREGQLKPLNLGLWRQLPRNLTKPIYHYLDKNLYDKTKGVKDRFEIGTHKFIGRIGVTGKYNPSQRRRLFTPHLKTLVELGFLSGFTFEPAKSPNDPEKVVIFPGERARRPASKKAKAAIDAENLLRHFQRTILGSEQGTVTKPDLKRATELLEQCGGDVQKGEYVINFVAHQAQKTGWTDIKIFGAIFAHDYITEALGSYARREKGRVVNEVAEQQRQLVNKYQQYVAGELDRWTAEHPEEFTKRLQAQKQQAKSRFNWSDETLTQYVTHNVRVALREEIPLLTPKEFAKKHSPPQEA